MMDIQIALEALARRWSNARRPQGVVVLADTLAEIDVPASLVSTITSAGPRRAQVMEDARHWLAAPRPAHDAPEIVLLNADEVAEKRGAATLAPALFQIRWPSPDGGEPNHRELSLASVVLESGQWRLSALWTKAERREAAKSRTNLAALQGLRLGGS